ncbi:MAG TPA: FAD-dependent oxidoreductase [Saprospiraceae bacterium]|nr:FAD-dependent oxidoreductase [Saprospiraceae bacterium]
MKEVVIVGGGIVGLCCAWHLHEAGLKVSIIDKGDFSAGCSFGNSGMIVPSHFIPLASPGMISKGLKWMFSKGSPFYIRPRLKLELAQWLWQFYRSADKKHVLESALLLRDMHIEGREFYRQLNTSSGFGFHFENKGILMMYQSTSGEHEEVETAEMAYELGIEANVLSSEALNAIDPGIKMNVRGAVHYPGDAHLAPQELMQQMIAQLLNSGVEFIGLTEVMKIEDKGKNDAEIHLQNKNSIHAKHVIIAAGSWSGMLMKKSGYKLPMQDGKGYSMTIHQPPGMPTIPAILTEARVAITPMGGHLRVAGTLEISGMDQRVNPHKIKSILSAASSYYPELKISDPGPAWYGYRPCTPDGMPYIGHLRKDSSIILATGHAMMGLSLAPATGRIVRDIILGKLMIDIGGKFNTRRFV